MNEITLDIIPYSLDYQEQLLELSIRSWDPVFPKMKEEISDYIYNSFYPEGWKARQINDIKAMLIDNETEIWLAISGKKLSGYVGLRIHREDNMGEIYIIAVDPEYQQQGVGSTLLEFAFDWMRQQNLAMVMVETGADQGHTPARKAYEKAGFERYPVARYFKKL